MFFHIFKNSFIIGENIPNEIRINNNISYELINYSDPDKILTYMASHREQNIIFYCLNDIVLNGTIKIYCMHMGLDYNAYITMVEHAKLYEHAVIKIYEPEYDDHYKKISKRTWSFTGQDFAWNIGILPFEYLINHVFHDDYATSIYMQMKDMYIEDEKRSARLSGTDYNHHIDEMSLQMFIDNPYNNMAFNDEFISFFFNKRLMNYLRKIKYTLPNMESGIDKAELERFNKENFEGKKPDYDNKLIYKDILA